MYEIIKSVILSRQYELSDMCHKIDVIWLRNQLTDSQRTGLLDLAREKADPRLSVDLYSKVMELESRMNDLEKAGKPTTEEFPEYRVGHTYHRGDGISFRSQMYRCITPTGIGCVWSPVDYPAYWEQIGE